MSSFLSGGRLEDQDRLQLLETARRLLAEADALSTRIAAVNEIGVAINQTLDLKVILQVVARQAKWLLDFEHNSVVLRENDSWAVTTLFGPGEPAPEDWMAAEHIGKALKFRQPMLIRENTCPKFLARYASQIIIPLVAEDTVMGAINFATTQPNSYTRDDMRIGYMLALELSSAIRNAHNFVELKLARDELTARAAELEARNQELDAYSHTIAHDLKSPLNNVILRSDVLLQRFPDLPSNVVQYLTSIRNSGKQMSEMIDQLLWLAKLRDPEEALSIVMMRPVIDAALARFNYVLEVNQIAVEVAGNLPHVIGNAPWLEEVFANLISNAIKYMGAGNESPGIVVRGNVRDGVARYEVEDTGIGISPEDQARLFTMFARMHTIQAEGIGLGLSIVHRIITRLNGKVGVESAREKGSTFWFTLPLTPEENPPVVSSP